MADWDYSNLVPVDQYKAADDTKDGGWDYSQFEPVEDKSAAPAAQPTQQTPGFFSSLVEGAKQGAQDVAGEAATLKSLATGEAKTAPVTPEEPTEFDKKFANASILDKVRSPEWWGSFIGQTGIASSPTLAAGLAGALAGLPAGPIGAGIGATLGVGAGAGLQTLADNFTEARRAGQSYDQALDTAIKGALVSAGINAASVPASFLRIARGPISHALTQLLVQPAIGAADQASQNVIAQQTGVDPNRPLMAGVPEAAIGEGLFGAAEAAGIVRPVAQAMRGRPEAAAETATTPPAEAPPAPAADVTLPAGYTLNRTGGGAAEVVAPDGQSLGTFGGTSGLSDAVETAYLHEATNPEALPPGVKPEDSIPAATDAEAAAVLPEVQGPVTNQLDLPKVGNAESETSQAAPAGNDAIRGSSEINDFGTTTNRVDAQGPIAGLTNVGQPTANPDLASVSEQAVPVQSDLASVSEQAVPVQSDLASVPPVKNAIPAPVPPDRTKLSSLNSFSPVVDVRQRKNGQWEVAATDPNGVYTTTRFPTEVEARAFAGQQAPAEAAEPAPKFKRRVPDLSQQSPTYSALRTTLDRMGLKDVQLKTPDTMGEFDGEQLATVIRVAQDANNQLGTLRHEAVHAANTYGLWKPEEYKALAQQAVKVWRKRYNIDTLYADEPNHVKTEEAIAAAAADKAPNPQDRPFIRRSLDRFNKFLDAVRSWSQGQGFRAADPSLGDQILQKFVSGKLGIAERPRDFTRFASYDEIARQAVRDYETGEAAHLDAITKATGERTTPDEVAQARGPLYQRKIQPLPDQQAEADYQNIFGARGQAPLGTRVRAMIRHWIDNGARELRQGILDDLDSIAHYEKLLHGRLLDAAIGAYKFSRLTRGFPKMMQIVLRSGVPDYVNGEVVVRADPTGRWRGGFEAVFNDLAKRGKLDEWKLWAVANRAQRLMQEGRENLLSQDMIDRHKDRHLLPGNQDFQAVLDKWLDFNKAILDFAEKAGLVDPQLRALFAEHDYIPFYRVIDEVTKGPRVKPGLAGQTSGIRKLTGGTDKLGDPIENMWMNMAHMIDASMKTIAANRVAALGTQAGVMRERPAGWEPHPVSAAQMATALRRIGVQVSRMTAQQRQQFVRVFTMGQPREQNVVKIMRNGRPVYYDVDDPLLFRSLTAMNARQAQALWIRMGGKASNLLRRGITTMPDFMGANAIRDTTATWVMTGKTNPISAMRGAVESLRNGIDSRDIAISGGGVSGYYDTNPSEISRQLSAKFHPLGDKPSLFRRIFHSWERIGEASEAMNRIATYRSLRQSGASRMEAAYQARDLLDFDMHGDWAFVRAMTTLVPFMNARLQGLYRLGRGIKANPAGVLARGLALSAAALAIAAYNTGQDWYEEMPDYDKDQYTPWKVGNTIYRIPNPFEIGAIYITAPTRMYRFFADASTDKGDMKLALQRFGSMIGNTFDFNPTPQFIKPVLEQWANRQFYTGTSIESPGMEDRMPGERFTPQTSALARKAGEALPSIVSPVRVDHIIRGYFGTLGLWLSGATSAILDRVGGPDVQPPSPRVEDVPGVGRFVRGEPTVVTKYVTEFYDIKDEATKVMRSAGFLAKNLGHGPEAQERIREYRAAAENYKMANRVGTKLSELNKQMLQVRFSANLSPDEKREKLNELLSLRNTLAERAVKAAKARTAATQ